MGYDMDEKMISDPPNLLLQNDFSFQAMPGVHEKVIELATPFFSESNIVILGSGEGNFEQKLLRSGISPLKLTSTDINPSQYKINGITCHFCDLNEKLFFEKDSFDLAIAIEVIEHLFNPHNLINEAYRIIKPGGRLFLTTPNVHSFPQKLRYLVTDQFLGFQEQQYYGSGHIHPIFDWLLDRMIEDKFHVEAFDSNRFQIKLPFLGSLRVPFRHRFFSCINIYRLIALKDAKNTQMTQSNKQCQ